MLFKKLIRTIGKYKAQFISMIIMVALGIGVFLGFNMEWVSLDRNTKNFMKETGFADYRVSAYGITSSDAEKINAIDGVTDVSRFFYSDFEVEGSEDADGNPNTLRVTVSENINVSGFKVMSGKDYDEADTEGVWLFDKYAEANDIKVGDEITFKNNELTFTGTVRGLIESGEYLICVRDESQLMPDFEKFGYIYISPAAFKDKVGEAVYENAFFQLNVMSSLDKEVFSERVNEAMEKTLLILSKDETVSYAESQGEVSEGKTMGSILPVLFLLIAGLIMVTTMHRLTVNEKIQIGTMKALGFKNKHIVWHYTCFSALIGIFGGILGVLLGYGIGWFIMNPKGMMGTYIVMPVWELYVPWWCWLILFGILLFLILIGFMSVRNMLKGSAADTLRPYTPKKTKKLLIERAKGFDKLSFGTKWNLRDVFRHKARSLMTLIGIVGSMVLVVAGLGMNDTAKYFINTYYDDVMNYNSRIYIKDTVTDRAAIDVLVDKYDGDYSAAVSINIKEEPYVLEVYNVHSGLVKFIDKNNKQIALPDNGALVCLRIAEEYKLKIGDELEFSPYGTNEVYTVKVAGYNRSMTESISVSEDYAKTLFYKENDITESSAYRISSIYTKTNKADIESDVIINSVQSKQDIVKSFDSFMDILNLSIIVLVLASVVLALVVLYNLGVMSYVERYREMATLKVVGFKNSKIANLLISQNLWLTVLGILIGLPAGVGTLVFLMKALASEYEMKVILGPLTYFVSILLTFGVSLIVGIMVAKKNKKINMVEALKGAE